MSDDLEDLFEAASGSFSVVTKPGVENRGYSILNKLRHRSNEARAINLGLPPPPEPEVKETVEVMEKPARLPQAGDVLVCVRRFWTPSEITYEKGDEFLLLEKAGEAFGRESSLGNWLVKDSRQETPTVWAKIEYMMVKGHLIFKDELATYVHVPTPLELLRDAFRAEE